MGTILAVLGFLVPIIRWVLDIMKVDKDTQDAFIKKIQSAKEDSKVPIQQSDEFKQQDEKLKDPPNGAQ